MNASEKLNDEPPKKEADEPPKKEAEEIPPGCVIAICLAMLPFLVIVYMKFLYRWWWMFFG